MDCSNLIKLNISFCSSIDGNILKDLTSIKELYIAGISSITETIFINLLNNNPQLQIIDVSMCNQLSESFIRSIKNSYEHLIIKTK